MPKSTKQLHKCESNSVELVKFTKNIGGGHMFAHKC